MINPDFQKYLENLTVENKDDALYLLLYESLEFGTELPPTVKEFTAYHKQAVEKLVELNIPITEKGLLQTINGWMFVLLREHPRLIIEYGHILGLSNDQWHKAIEEIKSDMADPEYYLGDKAVEHIEWLERELFPNLA